MTNAQNRKRWAVNQNARAAAKFAAELPSVADQRASKLAALLQLAASLEGHQNMATTLERVRLEIASLTPT